MYIYLSGALAERMGAELDEADAIVQSIQNLAQTRAQGDHVLTGHDTTLKVLANHSRLSRTTRGIFQRVREEQAKFGGLRKRLRTRIEIDTFREPIKSTVEQGGMRVLNIPLIRFQRNDIAQPTFLVAENLHDCRLLLLISAWVCKTYLHGRLPSTLTAVFVPGGGDTTDRVLEHLSKEQRYLALCFTDSDVLFPGGPLGQTSKKCTLLSLAEHYAHFVLKTRAAENLLSVAQIRRVLEATHERAHLLRKLERIAHLANTPAWLHLPMKDGVPELVGPPKPKSEQEFWYYCVCVRPSHLDGAVVE